MSRQPLMVRAALLRRSCEGAATESLLRRSCADQLRRAHSARRVCDGADAAATEQMLRAALLRRSCDGVAALVREVDAVDHHPISPMLVGLAARLQHATPLERGELVYDLMAKRPGESQKGADH